MEDVLDVYELPYDARRPVVCMDEKPYQLLGEAREPLPMIPGSDRETDSEYVRNGTISIFAFVEPLGGTHHVSVREHRTAVDWAEEIKYLSDVMYPDAEKIIPVMITSIHINRLRCTNAIRQKKRGASLKGWRFIIPQSMAAGWIWRKLN